MARLGAWPSGQVAGGSVLTICAKISFSFPISFFVLFCFFLPHINHFPKAFVLFIKYFFFIFFIVFAASWLRLGNVVIAPD